MMKKAKMFLKGALAFVLLVLAAAGQAAAEEPVEEEQGPLRCGAYTYELTEEGGARILLYEGEEEKVRIPYELDGYVITSISEGAFAQGGIHSVEIPDGLVQTGANPFAGCTDLEEFVISPYHDCFAVIDGVLFEKKGRKLISYPQAKEGQIYEVPYGIEQICAWAFSGSSLQQITLAPTVRSIGSLAMADCRELTDFTIPDTVQAVGDNPFAGCSSLTGLTVSEEHPACRLEGRYLTDAEGSWLIACLDGLSSTEDEDEIPQGITGIGAYAFYDADVTQVVLPEGLSYVSTNSFVNCRNLASAVFPAGISEVGEDAFSGCENLVVTVASQYMKIYCDRNNLSYVYADEGSLDWLTGEPENGQQMQDKKMAEGEIWYAREPLNVRVLPGSENNIIGQLDKGDAVRIAAEPEGQWVYIMGTNIIGYVNTEFLSPVEPQGAENQVRTDGQPVIYPGTNGHIVCIDAGHQQHGISEMEANGPGSTVMKAKLTTGTQGNTTGLVEYQLNLDVALLLKEKLLARGYGVVMIRETNDCPLSNAERAQVANSSGAEIFIRIHANSSDDPNVRGAMFYGPSPANPYMTPELIAQSNALSGTMLNSFCMTTGLKNLGVLQDDGMTGINWCTIPVTIAEMGFMSNPEEDRLMADPAFQSVMADGLAAGIDTYFGLNTIK